VAGRQVIGEIGDTGLTSDNSLYFEIRHGSDPLDPLMWLRRR
jgi:septal ring factor EnvC (AmiA/AmiB activator)